jgi:hypothetical protein
MNFTFPTNYIFSEGGMSIKFFEEGNPIDHITVNWSILSKDGLIVLSGPTPGIRFDFGTYIANIPRLVHPESYIIEWVYGSPPCSFHKARNSFSISEFGYIIDISSPTNLLFNPCYSFKEGDISVYFQNEFGIPFDPSSVNYEIRNSSDSLVISSGVASRSSLGLYYVTGTSPATPGHYEVYFYFSISDNPTHSKVVHFNVLGLNMDKGKSYLSYKPHNHSCSCNVICDPCS